MVYMRKTYVDIASLIVPAAFMVQLNGLLTIYVVYLL